MGIIINVLSIIIGGFVGMIIGQRFKESIKNIIMECIALFVIISGIKNTVSANHDIVVLVYLIIGASIGQIIDIDLQIRKMSIFMEKKFSKITSGFSNSVENSEKKENFSKGFSVTTIIFCAGAMSVIGSINSGLLGDNKVLGIKSILDGVTALVFASIYGIGVLFSAIPVLIYEGVFYLFSRQIKAFLNPQIISDLNFLGGIMILGLGVNLLLKKDIKVANMLPSILIPIIVGICKKYFF